MTLRVTVLGFSGSYAAPGGACSGYLVESGEARFWVDCGAGTLANLQVHLDLNDLDAIFVSHHHPDHFAELPIVYNTFKWYLHRSNVPVYAPASVRDMADMITGNPTADVFEWHVMGDGDRIVVADTEIWFARTEHTIENLATRYSVAGQTLVYTGDTGPGWDMAAFAGGADFLIGEATMLARQEDPDIPHISSRQLGERAAQAGVGRLLPTHIMPGNDPAEHVLEAAEAFGGTTELPMIGKRFEV